MDVPEVDVAGDWMPLRLDLDEDPKVIRLAGRLKLTIRETVGALVRWWSWVNKHLSDGNAPGVTAEWLDRYVSLPGFAAGLAVIGWLEVTEDGIRVPEFDEWNSQSAKKRLLTAKRVRQLRAECGDSGVPDVTPPALPERYQRTGHDIKDINTPPTPPLDAVAVKVPTPEEFREAWNVTAARAGWRPCAKLSDKRAAALRQRVADPFWLEHWRAALAKAEPIPGLAGLADKPWVANAEWFLRPDTVLSIIEGKYDNWTATRAPVKPDPAATMLAQAQAAKAAAGGAHV